MNSCLDHIKITAENDIPIFGSGRFIIRFSRSHEPHLLVEFELFRINPLNTDRFKIFNQNYVHKVRCEKWIFNWETKYIVRSKAWKITTNLLILSTTN